jgi:hypothetical protein
LEFTKIEKFPVHPNRPVKHMEQQEYGIDDYAIDDYAIDDYAIMGLCDYGIMGL